MKSVSPLLVAALLCTTACASPLSPNGTEINSVAPWGNAVATDTPIAISFNAPIQASSLSVTLEPKVELEQIANNDNKTWFSFRPTSQLNGFQTYKVTISAKDSNGAVVQGKLSNFAFTTQAATAPTQTIEALPVQTPVAQVPNTPGVKPTFQNVQSWGLQYLNYRNNSLGEIENSNHELVAVSRFDNGGYLWKKQDVANVAKKKWVVGYMSFGNAQTFEWYFKKSYETNPPAWLLHKDLDWNQHMVELDHPEWIAIVKQTMSDLITQGFDGVFVDTLDIYYSEGYPGGPSDTNKRRAISLVCQAAQYARSIKPDFKMVVNNAADLIYFPEYANCVDASVAEGLYFKTTDKVTTSGYRQYIERAFDEQRRQNKKVLLLDYAVNPGNIQYSLERAKQKGYVPYVAPGILNSLLSF